MRRPARVLRRIRRRLFPPAAITPGEPPPPLEFVAPASVEGAIAALERTEDIRFSPAGTLLAIAGFARRRILLLELRIESRPSGGIVVQADDFMEVASEGIGMVHGIEFLGERMLAVANRDGLVSIIRLPEGGLAGREVRADVLRDIRGTESAPIESPGSVAVGPSEGGRLVLTVCNNYAHTVTRHVVDPAASYAEVESSLAFSRGLDVPDGIAVSGDGRWVAVSSHYSHDVKLFEPKSGRPAGAATGSNYPHGLRFTADDRHLLVADAGGPFVHVYEGGPDWSGRRSPARSVTVLDEATFRRGRTNPEEGGPKGIDIDPTGRVLAMTCEQQRLVFLPMSAFVAEAGVDDEVLGAAAGN